MKMLTFRPEGDGTEVVAAEIPAELHDEALLWRSQMLDQLALYSDELTELLLGEQPVPEALVRKTLRAATLGSMIVPVLCGSALDGIGVQPVLDAVADYLPSPADMPPVEGCDPKKKDAKLSRKPDAAEPFSGLVFKIQADRHGDLHYVRVYSGVLKANSRMLQPRQGQEGKRPATVAHPGRRAEAGRPGRGRRHHRRRRPASQRHRRHALRPQRADPPGVDHLPRDGHLDGHRAGSRPPSGRSWPTCWR